MTDVERLREMAKQAQDNVLRATVAYREGSETVRDMAADAAALDRAADALALLDAARGVEALRFEVWPGMIDRSGNGVADVVLGGNGGITVARVGNEGGVPIDRAEREARTLAAHRLLATALELLEET